MTDFASKPITTPRALKARYPLSDAAQQTVRKTRTALYDILNGNNKRLVIVVGPCSIHDANSAIEYATRLQKLIKKYEKTLCIIMRTYVEKPRTVTGWKGLINDPYLTATFEIDNGLSLAREILLEINQIGVPTGSEILSPLIAPYISDLLSWSVIGARTVESQIHRELASSLPMAVGFKNSTDGNTRVAMDAVQAANHPHHFLNIGENAALSTIQSPGNPYCHLVLRGAHDHTNFDANSINCTTNALRARNLCEHIMIDCSHGNSQKNPQQQTQVVDTLCEHIRQKRCPLFGVMLESHLINGRQQLVRNNTLTYGQSITDACIGWDETEHALEQLHEAVSTLMQAPESMLT